MINKDKHANWNDISSTYVLFWIAAVIISINSTISSEDTAIVEARLSDIQFSSLLVLLPVV